MGGAAEADSTRSRVRPELERGEGDDPALARSVLAQRADLSPPERLLLELAVYFGVEPRTGQP